MSPASTTHAPSAPHTPASTTSTPPASASHSRRVPTRRIDFGFDDVDLPRHFMNDDLVGSHVVAVLSCLFPEGEDFFVRSVRNYRDQITDPELKAQVAGFIGQEAIHGREHRSFNTALSEVGYPVRFLDGRVRIGLGILARVAPKSYQLALTAALEHYTATLAEVLLTTETMQEDTDIEEIRKLFAWHALEENEHKSVAFDVFMKVCGKERVRVNVMRMATVGFLMAVVTGTTVSLALDPAARDIGRLRRSLSGFRQKPMVSKRMWSQIREYNRPGFHPDDRDTTALLEEWRQKLFGEHGELNDKLKGATAA